MTTAGNAPGPEVFDLQFAPDIVRVEGESPSPMRRVMLYLLLALFALLLGWASKSLLLEAFGIDSVVELFSAGVLLWRLKVEAGGLADETRVEAVERRAARWVGYSLYGLVAYVICNCGYG